MFIDIVGSTTLSERADPRDVVALLNEFFGEVVGAVRRSGGWVNKFEGDAALCVFGAPMSQDDAAAAVLEAALALREALHPLPLDAGIGVSVGEVVAGNVGAEDRYEYTVIGPAVNEAARLSDYAKEVPERLVVDARVIEAARAEHENWRAAGEVRVKGVLMPLAVVVPAVGNP
jgi:adenylate cyclase